jgi:hypothetical protein
VLPLVGWLSDKFGRKKVLLCGIFIILVATVIGAASVNFGMFVFSRALVGAGGMLVVQPSPLLIAELAYPTHRGKYTSAFWTMYYLGMSNEPYSRILDAPYELKLCLQERSWLRGRLLEPRTMKALGAGEFRQYFRPAGKSLQQGRRNLPISDFN